MHRLPIHPSTSISVQWTNKPGRAAFGISPERGYLFALRCDWLSLNCYWYVHDIQSLAGIEGKLSPINRLITAYDATTIAIAATTIWITEFNNNKGTQANTRHEMKLNLVKVTHQVYVAYNVLCQNTFYRDNLFIGGIFKLRYYWIPSSNSAFCQQQHSFFIYLFVSR